MKKTNIIINTPSEESQILLSTLKDAVHHALEKKKMLGQYAVVWKNGQASIIDFKNIDRKNDTNL